jgi:hypothetical protein
MLYEVERRSSVSHDATVGRELITF